MPLLPLWTFVASSKANFIIIIIIIIINCNWVVTRWQWLFYMHSFTSEDITVVEVYTLFLRIKELSNIDIVEDKQSAIRVCFHRF
jgi:hypothetical protein